MQLRSSRVAGAPINPELPKTYSASGTRSKRARGRAGAANTRNGRFVPIPDSWNVAKRFARDHLRKSRCTTPKAGLESVGYLSTGKPPPKIDEAVFVEYRLNSGCFGQKRQGGVRLGRSCFGLRGGVLKFLFGISPESAR